MSLSQQSSQSAAFFPKLDSLNDPHTRKHALLEIEKTAVKLANMDKSEATPVVIEVCWEISDMLNYTVLRDIQREHQADVDSLQEAYNQFQEHEDARQAAQAQLEAAEALVTQRSMALVNCRSVEEQTCVNETICTTDNYWCERVIELERQLQEPDREIHRMWCEETGGNAELREETTFREGAIIEFTEYQRIVELLIEAIGNCEAHEQSCETSTATYITQATECNGKQTDLIHASCEYHQIASGALRLYQQGYLATLTMYNELVSAIMVREADRKVEWDVITRVICLLLTLTNEDDGVVSSDETAARIERCWNDFVDTSHLDIFYLDPPPMLSLPDLPPLPCTSDYNEHYNTQPPEVCTALISLHNTQADSECTCLADELSNQGIMLGHYLLVDPDIDVTVSGTQWTTTIDGQVYTGPLSSTNTDDFTALSSQMLTEDQLDQSDADYTGPIHSIVWAYPSPAADFSGATNLAQRFARNGGMLFLNAGGEVIEVRQLASAPGTLEQPVSATMSFSSAEELTEAQMTAACPAPQAIPEGAQHYAQGARSYCWVMGGAIPQCQHGCFLYGTTSGPMVFPLIEGLHISNFAQ